MNEIIDGLAALVGRDNVAADPASLEEYAQDESFVPRLTPWAVVRPGSAEEVQQVVAWANETATPLVPVSSGGPHFHGDTVPSVPGAVMLDLRRMDKILRVDRRNRMVVIEPGVTYPQLQAALAEQGMRVTPPLYPRANKSVVASLLERQPTLIPRYNFHLPEPLRSCGVVWGNGDVMFTGEAGTGPLSLEAQWQGGLVQADPKGPGQTDFFRLLTGAQGTIGVVTWAAVQVRARPVRARVPLRRRRRARRAGRLHLPARPHPARRRGPDLQRRVPGAAAQGRRARPSTRTRCRRGRSSSASAAGSTSPPSASRCRRRTPRRWPASSASRCSRRSPARPPATSPRCSPAAATRRGSSPRRAPAPTCSSSPRSRRRPPSSRSRTSSPTATATPRRTSASTSSRSTRA